MRIEPPFSKWSEYPLWFRVVFTVAFINFIAFWILAIAFGGDAINGYKHGGHYYLGSHGTYKEVSAELWTYSYYHTISVWITHLSVFVGFAIILNSKRQTKKAEQGAAANP
jgi:hypothetical protein